MLDTVDFDRSFSLLHAVDSVQTERGWKHRYQLLASGTLNSQKPHLFTFSSTRAQRFKLLIENGDNEPLQLDSPRVSGYVHELLARFARPADYFLAYGTPHASKPRYDIERFQEAIPKELTALEVGPEVTLARPLESTSPAPLIASKKWLWLAMFLVMAVLGWFTITMMKNAD